MNTFYRFSDITALVACHLSNNTQYSTNIGKYLNEISVDENGIFETTSKDTPMFGYLKKLSEILGVSGPQFSNTQYIIDKNVTPFSCFLFRSFDRSVFREDAFKMYLSHICFRKFNYLYDVYAGFESKSILDNISENIRVISIRKDTYYKGSQSQKFVMGIEIDFKENDDTTIKKDIDKECLQFLRGIESELKANYDATIKKYSFIYDAVYNLPYTSTEPELELHYLKLVFYLTSKREPFDFRRFTPFVSLLQKEPLAFSDITILVQNLKKTFPEYNDQLFVHFQSKKLIPISVITAAGVTPPKKYNITNNGSKTTYGTPNIINGVTL